MTASALDYDSALGTVAAHVDGAHRIDRVQIDRHQQLYFCINGITWCSAPNGRFLRLYALDDDSLPLAHWAARQAAGSINVVAYRPHRRIVIKDLSRNRVIKGYATGKSHKAAEKHRIAERALHKAPGLSIPHLFAHCERLSAITLSHCKPPRFRITEARVEDFRRIGALLGHFQISTSNPDILKTFSAQDELAVLADWETKTASVSLDPPEAWRHALAQLKRTTPSERHKVLTHRDFHDGQLLADHQSLCLLDFDSLCLADPMVDIANFAAHVELRYLQWRNRNRATMGQKLAALKQGYEAVMPFDNHAYHWYRATALLRLAQVYALRPRWRFLSTRITNCAIHVIAKHFPMEADNVR